MQPRGVHHVSLTVDDLGESLAFYFSLGCEQLPRPDLGFPGAWLALGEQQIHLLELHEAGPPRVAQHFAIKVDDLDAAVHELRGTGVNVDGPFDIAPVGRQAFLNDPSGNQIELHETIQLARCRLAPAELELLDRAAFVVSVEAAVRAPVSRVWQAVTSPPGTWRWYPGVTGGGFVGEPGVGAGRWLALGRGRVEETVLAWDDSKRFAYRVDGTSFPLADSLVESWDLEPVDGGDTTSVRWTFAAEPRLALRAARPLAELTMRRLFLRAMQNLERELSTTTPAHLQPGASG